MFLQLLFLLALATVLWDLYNRYSQEGRLFAKIPGPKGWPIAGNAFTIMLHPDELFKFGRRLHKEFPNIAKIQVFGYKGVNIYNPEDVEVILSDIKHNHKNLPYRLLTGWLGNGLLINNGTNWHERRKMLSPAFHFNPLKKFLDTFTKLTDELVEIIQTEVSRDKTDVHELVVKTTLRIICETTMDGTILKDSQSVTNKYFNALNTIRYCIFYRATTVWLYPRCIFNLTKVGTMHRAALNELHGFTKQMIQEKREKREKTDMKDLTEDEVYGNKRTLAMMDILLEQEKMGKINSDGIREEIDTFIFAGHDTTTVALTYILMLIANNQDAQSLLHQEMERIFGDSQRHPIIEDLNEMKYLECCIKETLRLYPSVPFIARQIREQVTLSGYKVPAGTVCCVHVYDIHHCEEIYPEPEKFIPERFYPENTSKRHPYAYIPFSAGPKNCIGQKYAMMEMKTIVSGLLRRFSLESITRPEDISHTCDFVLRSTQPIYVRFCNRKAKKI